MSNVWCGIKIQKWKWDSISLTRHFSFLLNSEKPFQGLNPGPPYHQSLISPGIKGLVDPRHSCGANKIFRLFCLHIVFCRPLFPKINRPWALCLVCLVVNPALDKPHRFQQRKENVANITGELLGQNLHSSL